MPSIQTSTSSPPRSQQQQQQQQQLTGRAGTVHALLQQGGADENDITNNVTMMIDEAQDPMAAVLDDTSQAGQVQPRNMSAWIARATVSILGKRYITQDASEASREFASAMQRNAYVQTEPPQMKDASAMIIDGNMESERLNNLDINIPAPAELPVLTTSQLLELERRLGDLMHRLEEETLRAEGEIKRAKEQQAEMEKREAIMHSNRFGKWQTNEEWVLHMRNKIEQRLHKRHGYADVPSLPTQKMNLDSTLNSPLRSRNQRARRTVAVDEDLDEADSSGVGRTDSRSFSESPATLTPARSVTPSSMTLHPGDGDGGRLKRRNSAVSFTDDM